MKRFLLLFLSAMLCCSLIAVPALATGVTEAEVLYSGKECYSSFSVNTEYPISLIFKIIGMDQDLIYVSTPVTIDLLEDNSGYFEVDLAEGYRLTYRLTNNAGTTDIDFFLGFCSDQTCYYLPDMIEYSRIDIVRVVAAPPVREPIFPPTGIFDVFSGVGSWIIASLGATSGLYWTGSSLTLIGMICVSSLGIAVILYLIAYVRRLLQFKG